VVNPQKEDGFTPIANEIMEALARTSLSDRESRILCVILRRTYGWNKKQDRISLSQFSKMTGIAIPNCSITLERLALRRIIIRGNNVFARTYSIQKNYGKWLSPPITLSKPITKVITADKQKVITPDKDLPPAPLSKDNLKTSKERQPNEIHATELQNEIHRMTVAKETPIDWSPPSERAFWEFWNQSYKETWELDYPRGKWDKRTIKDLLSSTALEVLMAYAYWFLQNEKQDAYQIKRTGWTIETFAQVLPQLAHRAEGRTWLSAKEVVTKFKKANPSLFPTG